MDYIRKLFMGDDYADHPIDKHARIKKRPTFHDLEIIDRIKRFFRYHWRGCFIIAVPICLSPLLLSTHSQEAKSGFVYLLIVFYWVSECLPVMVTSMLPIALLPMLGILGSEDTCRSYFKDTTIVMMGGIIIAMAVEYSNLHYRLALLIIKRFTCYPRVLHLALMGITFCLSTTMSNTATAALMSPIVRAILENLNDEEVMKIYLEMEKNDSNENRRPTPQAIAFYLGVAYSATIGGVSSLIGSGTNLSFKYQWELIYYELNNEERPHDYVVIQIGHFMGYCFPISFLLLCCTYIYLQVYLMGLWRPGSEIARQIMDSNKMAKKKQKVFNLKYKNLRKITCHEITIAVLILILLVLYLTRAPDFMDGWANALSTRMKIKNALPTIFIVFLIFFLPASYSFLNYCRGKGSLPTKEVPGLLTWKYIQENMPWSLMFVVGGGFAIGRANKSSKLVHKVAGGLLSLRSTNKLESQLIFEVIMLSMFLTAFGSNVSIVDQSFGFLAEASLNVKKHPLILFYPAVLASSMAFHLPVSTPPNAIACGFGNIKTKDIIYAGIGPTLSAILLLEIFCLYWSKVIYSGKRVDLDEYPNWAETFNITG